MMRRANLKNTLLTILAFLPCALSAQEAPQTLEEMWQVIQQQQAEIDALKQKNTQLEQQSTGPVPQLEQTTTSMAEDTPKEAESSLEVFGFAQVDAIYDFDRVDPNWNDSTRPSKIPVEDPRVFGADGESIISVRQSRLGFRGTTPTSMGALKTWLEWDLYAAGSDEGETELNLRHFWGELGNFGGGQTWTNWMDIDIFPNTIDYWGPAGMVFIRKPQIRYTQTLDDSGTLWSIALEDPNSDVDPGELRDVAPGLAELGDSKESLFDLTGRYRSENDWGHWQAAGIIRRLEYETKSDGSGNNPDNDPSDTDWGWGLNLTTVAGIFNQDKLKLGLVYGEGIAAYFNDGGSSLAADDNGVSAVESLGISAFYDHYWDENWSSSVGWSMHEQDNTKFQQDDAFKRGQIAQANLLWSKEEFLTGFEVIWAQRENNGGDDNTDFRVQYTLKYNFAHDLL